MSHLPEDCDVEYELQDFFFKKNANYMTFDV
jgi:hypothetical protein